MNRSEFLKSLGMTIAGVGLSGATPLSSVFAQETQKSSDPNTSFFKHNKLDQEAKVSKPVSVVVIGAGARGSTYAGYAQKYPGSLAVVGVADPQQKRRDTLASLNGILPKHQFSDWKEVLKQPKFADAVIIATPDNMHFEPCMAALAKGYDVLLEKPIAQTAKECEQILAQAKKYNRIVGVCHVLRYAPYFIALKQVLESGEIGEIVSMQHMECIRFHHMAHSYVRGNWAKAKETTPIVVAKSCHDMDLMRWLLNKPCKSISANGALTLFNAKNKPEGAAERCLECKHESKCAFSAKKIYLKERKYLYVFDIPEAEYNAVKHEGYIRDRLATTNYGKCVFQLDNDQCDHFVAALEFEDNVTAAFSMEAFTPTGGRLSKFMGTKGYIEGNMKSFTVTDFLTNEKKVWNQDISDLPGYQGHAGGDWGIMKDFILAVSNQDPNMLSSTIDVSVESHIMGFRAEESRVARKMIKLNK